MIEEAVSVIASDAFKIVGGFVGGFLVSRLTMSKAERKQHQQRLYENSREHRSRKEERYLAFSNALHAYVEKKGRGDLKDFHHIATSGELYFGELRMIADAILGGKVDRDARDNTFVPDIVDALQKSIPAYYAALMEISTNIGASYSGVFKRENYESLYRVAERYGRTRTISPPTSG